MACLPTRPAVRYPGGKWRLAPWVIKHFPAHRVYVEPFGGAASVLLRKAPSQTEVYNDLEDEVVNLFRVLRDPELSAQLVEQVKLTPFARVEFDQAREVSCDPVEKARRFIARAHMGQGSCVLYESNGFRGKRSGDAWPARDWFNFPPALEAVARRLRGVTVESLDALEILKRYDGPGVLFYLDPPYVHSTRTAGSNKAYRHEMDDEQHAALAERLHQLQGYVVLSGYDCELYRELYSGWNCVRRETRADRAVKRIECLWMSPETVVQGSLMEVVG